MNRQVGKWKEWMDGWVGVWVGMHTHLLDLYLFLYLCVLDTMSSDTLPVPIHIHGISSSLAVFPCCCNPLP